MWIWRGIKIPEKWCFKKDKKCTPSCESYDMGWLTEEEDDSNEMS